MDNLKPVQRTSETKCSNPFCTDGQTEQGSCLRCGGTGRETVARPSKDDLTDEDAANIGRALMERLPPGYHWNDCPTEIVTDLLNEIHDLKRAPDETVSAPAAERVPLRYGKPFTGIHRGISRGGFHCTDNDCSCHLYQYPRAELKANACQCDPNPSIGGSPPCPVHDGESEVSK